MSRRTATLRPVTHIDYGGVRKHLDGLGEHTLRETVTACQAYIDAGMRPPLLTIRADGVDVSERPDLWPSRERDYRGPGRLEWIGEQLS